MSEPPARVATLKGVAFFESDDTVCPVARSLTGVSMSGFSRCTVLMFISALGGIIASNVSGNSAKLTPRPREKDKIVLIAMCDDKEHALSKAPEIMMEVRKRCSQKGMHITNFVVQSVEPGSIYSHHGVRYEFHVQNLTMFDTDSVKDWSLETFATLNDQKLMFRFVGLMQGKSNGTINWYTFDEKGSVGHYRPQ